MHKYRIVERFNNGGYYEVQKRFLLFFWRTAIYSSAGDDYQFKTVKDAVNAIERLKKAGSVVWVG